MTELEKQLVLKDLCGRLPYGVAVRVVGDWFEDEREPYDRIVKDDFSIISDFLRSGTLELRPYLRPMSSMTEDEMGDYGRVKFSSDGVYKFTDYKKTGKGFVNVHTVNWNTGEKSYTFQVNSRTMLHEGAMGIDWLNEHYFDYRGLIGMGLALKIPELNYD